MIIFSLLVLILFSSINGMIIERDPYLPEVLDDYQIKCLVSDGCLVVPQEKLDKLYLGNMGSDLVERLELDLKKSEIDLTQKTFYQDQKYTVGNVSRAINYLNGKNLLDLSVEQRCELLHCVDSLASDGAHKEVVDLAVTLYKDVQKGSVDEETQRLVSSIFNPNSPLLYKTNGYLVSMINMSGQPYTIINGAMITRLIKNAPHLSLLKVNGFFMPVLPKGTLTNPTPPNDCTIDLSNNEISEIEPGAVEWWNKGQLILNNNPLTEESIKRLQQDTRMPLSKHLANSKAHFFGYSKPLCLLLYYGLISHPSMSQPLSKFVGLKGSALLAISLGYTIGSLDLKDLSQKKYFPLKLKIGNSDEYKPMFDVPLD